MASLYMYICLCVHVCVCMCVCVCVCIYACIYIYIYIYIHIYIYIYIDIYSNTYIYAAWVYHLYAQNALTLNPHPLSRYIYLSIYIYIYIEWMYGYIVLRIYSITCTRRIACERDDVSLAEVAPVARASSACLTSASISAAEATGRSTTPTTWTRPWTRQKERKTK